MMDTWLQYSQRLFTFCLTRSAKVEIASIRRKCDIHRSNGE